MDGAVWNPALASSGLKCILQFHYGEVYSIVECCRSVNGENIRMPEVQTVQSEKVAKPAIRVGQFNGALSRFQVSAYTDLVYANVPKNVAHKIAADFGSDLGKLMATDERFAATIGKANKSGESRIKLTGGAKVTTSRAMSTIRVAQQVDALYQEGLLASRDMPVLSDTLIEYREDCIKWAGEQTWS